LTKLAVTKQEQTVLGGKDKQGGRNQRKKYGGSSWNGIVECGDSSKKDRRPDDERCVGKYRRQKGS